MNRSPFIQTRYDGIMSHTNTAAISEDILTEVRRNTRTNLVLDSRKFYQSISRTDEKILKNWHNINTDNIQGFSSARLFKLFAANDASFSASLQAHVRMLHENFRITAKKSNRTSFKEGQQYLDSLVDSFEYSDGLNGFSLPNTLNDQIARIGRNILTSDNSSGALFIQLDDDFHVVKFQVVDCDRIKFRRKNRTDTKDIPYITVDNREVELDFANFLWQPLDPDADQLTGNNPLRPGLRSTFTKMEFMDNLRKVLNNQAWPKIKVVLDEQSVLQLAPPEVRQDPKKLIDFFNTYIGKVEDQLTGIDPDQNIIVWDTVKEIDFLESKGNFDPNAYAKLLESEQISSFKSPPSVVGKGGSQDTGEGLASAELVIFRRTIKAYRSVIETLYSRAFTMAMRLNGLQGFAKFRFKEFTLRPPEESAQFDSIRQDTVITAWEVGAIGDQEKDKKIRHMHGTDGPAPEDAKIREQTVASGKQGMRDPANEDNREGKRRQTRRNQKIGNDR